jgi:hypothetical protein
MAKKVYNFNEMRKVIVLAHNSSNNKAISKDMVAGAGVGAEFFEWWKNDTKKLQNAVWTYVKLKKNQRNGDNDITDEAIKNAYEMIFPLWKEILATGERSKVAKELHVQLSDVEDLIGFVWDFMPTTRGTVEHQVTDNQFRKKVESLLGCIIAKNAVLNDNDRDILKDYQKYIRVIDQTKERIAELETSKKNLEDMKRKNTAEKNFVEYLDKAINETKEEIKAQNDKLSKAEVELAKVSTDAKNIKNRMKLAK